MYFNVIVLTFPFVSEVMFYVRTIYVLYFKYLIISLDDNLVDLYYLKLLILLVFIF